MEREMVYHNETDKNLYKVKSVYCGILNDDYKNNTFKKLCLAFIYGVLNTQQYDSRSK